MKLGEYEIIERIASGGMAEVFRGRVVGEEGFEKPIAIKRILPHFAQDSRFVNMLVQEARIHASLHHRNIVQIHDLGLSQDGEYFIVLEYVDGRDLGALLEVLSRAAPPGNRMGDALALYVAIELGEGVHFAHQHCGPDGRPSGLVHRDISPSNVLLSYAGEVKLSDFGLAKRQTDQSVVGSLKGKLEYMSPEQARRWPLDRRSDIFSLGTVLFEMLMGKRLRSITDEVDGWRLVASGVMASPRSVRPDLPPALERLLSRALAPNPGDRFEDAAAFVFAAREALEQVPRAKSGEAAEMQLLLRSFLPPGAPRPDTEPSRVIRLVSEFWPRPGQGAAGLTRPRAPSKPAPAPPRSVQPAPATDMATTVPGPHVVGKPRAATPPPPPSGDAHRRKAPTGKTRNERVPSQVPADDLGAVSGEVPVVARTVRTSPPPGAPRVLIPDVATREQPPVRLDAPVRPRLASPAAPLERPATRPPTPAPPPPGWPAPSGPPFVYRGGAASDLAMAPASGPWAPPPALPDLAPSPGGPGFSGVIDYDTPVLPPPRSAWLLKPRRRGGGLLRALLVLVLLMAGAATYVHLQFVPLPVLLRWGRPAQLRVTSTPSGAEVMLDGVRLLERTPLLLSVPRDRLEHEIEVRRDGYTVARHNVRFDRDVIPHADVALMPARPPSLEPLPTKVAAGVAPVSRPEAAHAPAAEAPPVAVVPDAGQPATAAAAEEAVSEDEPRAEPRRRKHRRARSRRHSRVR